MGKDYDNLKRKMKEEGILFPPHKYSARRCENVPEEHRSKFDAIQQLGRLSFEKYDYAPGIDGQDKPWQKNNSRKALRLVRDAVRCRAENRNEPGWRYELEPQIFERFNIEVAW